MAEDEEKKKKNKLRPFLKAHREYGGTSRAFPIPGAFVIEKPKEDTIVKPNEDRIFNMLKDINDGDRCLLCHYIFDI